MRLYKYYPPTEMSARLFTHKEIYFSHWSDFNDPFELMGMLDFGSSESTKFDYFNCHVSYFRTLQSRDEKLNYIRNFEEMYSDGHQILHILKSDFGRIGIFCASESNNEMLLWSHYAKGHRGFCVEFETDLDREAFKDIRKVDYTTDYVPLKFYEGFRINDVVTKKYDQWAYEKEWRVFKSSPGLVQIDPKCVKRIILGASYHQIWDKRDINGFDIIPIWNTQSDFKHVDLVYLTISRERYQLFDDGRKSFIF